MKILFVDDEVNVLNGLQRMLRRQAGEWQMRFVSSGQEALDILAKEPFDIIVSDARMPGMDGVQLLTTVRQKHPEVVRIMLSGHAGEDYLLRAAGPAHQCLSKPCDSEKIQSTVRRALVLRNAVRNERLQKAVASMGSLPSLPSLYQRIMQELRKPDPSIGDVAKVAAQDVAMSAKLLQLVNSSFFGLAHEVSDPARAVVHLGIDTVRSLALCSGVFEELDADTRVLIGGLWHHSARTACIARRIAVSEGVSRDIADATFQAGFLHDVGKLVLAANMPDLIARLGADGITEHERGLQIERETLGVTHAEVGGYLLGIWGLPDAVVEVVMFNHSTEPPVDDGFSILAAVQFADAVDHRLDHKEQRRPGSVPEECRHLERMGTRLARWWQAVEEGKEPCKP